MDYGMANQVGLHARRILQDPKPRSIADNVTDNHRLDAIKSRHLLQATLGCQRLNGNSTRLQSP